jgi:hypothetical protein
MSMKIPYAAKLDAFRERLRKVHAGNAFWDGDSDTLSAADWAEIDRVLKQVPLAQRENISTLKSILTSRSESITYAETIELGNALANELTRADLDADGFIDEAEAAPLSSAARGTLKLIATPSFGL